MDLLATNTLFSLVLKYLYYPFTDDAGDDAGDAGDDDNSGVSSCSRCCEWSTLSLWSTLEAGGCW